MKPGAEACVRVRRGRSSSRRNGLRFYAHRSSLKFTSSGRPSRLSVARIDGARLTTFPRRTTAVRAALKRIASTGSRASSTTQSALLPTAIPYPSIPRIFAGVVVTASKAYRMASIPVICATCKPMCATSSMSPEPRLYHGSITQSWPNATSTPAASSSGTRVMPRRFG